MLGLLVGTLILLARAHRVLSVLMPVVATTIAAALVFLAVRQGIARPRAAHHDRAADHVPPGQRAHPATVELASSKMVAGASRLVCGGMQLLLLAFGIVAGAELARSAQCGRSG